MTRLPPRQLWCLWLSMLTACLMFIPTGYAQDMPQPLPPPIASSPPDMLMPAPVLPAAPSPPDGLLSAPILPPAPAQTNAPVTLPPVIPADSSQPATPAPPIAPVNTAELTPPELPAIQEPDSSDTYHSVMFTPEELQRLEALIARIRAGKKPEETAPPNILADLIDSKPKSYIFPQYFLDSIIYHTSSQWTLWVNGVKYTPDEVESIEKLKLNVISPAQASFTLAVPRDSDVNLKQPVTDERVQIDVMNRQVTFLLQPNQTFSSYNMKIYEGKVQPVTFDSVRQQSDALPDAAEAPAFNLKDIFFPEEKKPDTETTKPEKKQGIMGLIDTYEHLKDVPY